MDLSKIINVFKEIPHELFGKKNECDDYFISTLSYVEKKNNMKIPDNAIVIRTGDIFGMKMYYRACWMDEDELDISPFKDIGDNKPRRLRELR